MKTKLLAGCAAACAAAALTGCVGMSGGDASDLLKQLDSNFATCDRHITFQGGVGVVAPGAQVSGSVDCKGSETSAAPAPARPTP
jgi:hypothetical protein